MEGSRSKRWRWILPVAVLLLLGTVGWIRRDNLDLDPLPVKSKFLAGLSKQFKAVEGMDIWCFESKEDPDSLEAGLRKELLDQAVWHSTILATQHIPEPCPFFTCLVAVTCKP